MLMFATFNSFQIGNKSPWVGNFQKILNNKNTCKPFQATYHIHSVVPQHFLRAHKTVSKFHNLNFVLKFEGSEGTERFQERQAVRRERCLAIFPCSLLLSDVVVFFDEAGAGNGGGCGP